MLGLIDVGGADPVTPKANDLKNEFNFGVQVSLKKYCLDCHSTKAKKGSLDLERFTTLDHIRKDIKPWQHMIEQLEAGEMPPKERPQPSADERKQIITWIRKFLDAEAHARAGDPGYVPLRRLSNAEYDYTIRDLTGVDLHPTREFPADGAAGEGFTNAAEALTDISPTLLAKYFGAAKEISEHAVLLPDGFQFSFNKTRRDWTDESLARIRKFYNAYTGDGRLPLQPYLMTTVRYRDALTFKKTTIAEVAAKEKLNAKYLGILWQALTDTTPSQPLQTIRAQWKQATERDVGPLSAEIAAWQSALWKIAAIGSYRSEQRQLANNPASTETQTLKLNFKPAPGQSEVVLYLQSRDMSADNSGGQVIWQRPRFEAQGKPALMLKDYPQFGPAFEVDFSRVFAESGKYLSAALELSLDKKRSLQEVADKSKLDHALLKRWSELLAIEHKKDAPDPDNLGKTVPAVPLDLLDEPIKNDQKPAITGWLRKGTNLPILLANASNTLERIPGNSAPHQVVVHPTPKEFVGVTWKSPVAGSIRVSPRVKHAHPNCGNGIAWWLQHRRGERASLLDEGDVSLGAEAHPPSKTFKVEKGDSLVFVIDAKNGDHSCDLTEIDLTVTEIEKPARTWSLAGDVANSALDGNPHADKHGNKEVWSFIKGQSKPVGKGADALIPGNSILGKWRAAANAKQPDTAKLAEQVQILLSGPRPAKEKDPDRILYDNLVSAESALLKGLDLVRFAKSRDPKSARFGLEKERFSEDASLVVAANSVTEIRLPATLFQQREFVVEGKLAGAAGNRVVQFQVLTTPPTASTRWDGKNLVVTSHSGTGYRQLVEGFDQFRKCFPQLICFPRILPEDEVVCLKMYHREDEALVRLFLDDEGKKRLDHLWKQHFFISQQAVAENNYLPQFIGFVTQDQPKELVTYFENKRPEFRARAEDFQKEYNAAIPKQLDLLLQFAARAYRRPVTEKESTELHNLYETIRKKGTSHDEAIRGVLARVLVSPAFLFRIEHAPAGASAGSVTDWELATRLSYFLWSSGPDEELRRLAAEGKLRDPKVLAEQTRRMLKDDRIRALAVEFGTQWLHVRGFDEFNEKNEKLFPTFDANLRKAINEESILFFQDLFQNDRTVKEILDSDATYLNELLAKHYGIPGISGANWRRVEGIRKFGRGGILGLASVQAKQSGASRTSPVLRGNWVVETLLGEKLPRPPANVPKLPEEEGGADKLTMRQQVEKHASVAECAVCHQRIDPFGFALEKYDSIGRKRDKDLGGLAVDASVKLKDGTTFEGIDGLRNYLQTKKKDVIDRLFCRKLLGYALGRSATLSDQSLIDEIMSELNKADGHLSAAVLAIVRSPQFRMIRGSDFGD